MDSMVALGSDADDRADILDGLAKFVDSVAVPLERKNEALLDDPRTLYGPDGSYSAEVRELLREVRTQSAQAGYYTMFAPSEVGGSGGGALLLYEVWEMLYRRYGPGRLLPYASVAHWAYGPGLLCAYLTPAAADEALPGIMAGQTTTCFAISEPDAGSDPWAMRTTALPAGEGWVVSGTKQWITNSPCADYVFVWAVTDPELRSRKRGGISCFLVPTTAPGFAVDSVIRLFGHAGGHEGIISFSDVQLPSSALVGDLHTGFDLAMKGISTGRLYNAGHCVGLARWATERAAAYARERVVFGNPIAEYQGISFMLADCAVDIYAADTMSRDCARRLDAGERATTEVAMVKLFSTEMCSRVYERAMQVHGGMGLTNEMKLYDGWHQARIVRIADGSAEIMRRNIARAVLSSQHRGEERR
jgi:acyl-CoA dehydrogenase